MCLCPQDGWTALHAAAHAGKVDVVRLLTEAQALVNIQTKVHTPRHVAHTVSLYTAVLGEVTVCLCPQYGWTALHLAAHAGKVYVVRLLTEAQALVNIQTKKVHTTSCLMIGLLLVYIDCTIVAVIIV